MVYFSYNDYIDCINVVKMDEISFVEEEIPKYSYNSGIDLEEYKNSIIKELKRKGEILRFLEDFFEYKNLENINDIKLCRSLKTSSDIRNNENLTFRITNNELYIFIKVIDILDTNISYKLFEHALSIIKNWNKKNNLNKRRPIVIPIVIYIGNNKWNKSKSIKNKKINYITYEKNYIKFSYSMININDFDTKQLKNMKSNLAKEMIEIKNLI